MKSIDAAIDSMIWMRSTSALESPELDFNLYRSTAGEFFHFSQGAYKSLGGKAKILSACRKYSRKIDDEKHLFFFSPNHEITQAIDGRLREVRKCKMREIRRVEVGYHLKAHYRTLWSIQDGRCYFSGELLGDVFESAKYHVDHLFPLAWHGNLRHPKASDWPTNLALVIPLINLRKSGFVPASYIGLAKKNKWHEIRASSERRRIDQRREKIFSEFVKNEGG